MTVKKPLPKNYRERVKILRKYANVNIDLRQPQSPQTKSYITRLWKIYTRRFGKEEAYIKTIRPTSAKSKRAYSRITGQSSKTWKAFFVPAARGTTSHVNRAGDVVFKSKGGLKYTLVPLPKTSIAGTKDAFRDALAQYPEQDGRLYKPGLEIGQLGGVPWTENMDDAIESTSDLLEQYANIPISGMIVLDNEMQASQYWQFQQAKKRASSRRIRQNRKMVKK